MDDEIAQQLVDVQHIFQVLSLAEGLQAADQPRLIGLGDGSFGVAEDIAVAVRVVVGILQLHVAAAHAHAAAEAPKAAGEAAASAGKSAVPAGEAAASAG